MNLGVDIITTRSDKMIISGKMTFAISSLVFSLVLFFIFIVPEYKNLKIMEIREKIEKDGLDNKNQILAKMKSFQRSLNDIDDADVEKIKMFLPSDDKLEFHLSNLDNMAAVHRLEISNLSVLYVTDSANQSDGNNASGPSIKNGELQGMIYSFRVKGAYVNVKAFLNSIESNIPVLKLESLAMSSFETPEMGAASLDEIAKKDVVTAEISLRSYYVNNK